MLFHHIVIFSGITKDTYPDRLLRTFGNASWIGVDLFFVLSGFLITGILFDAKGSPAYFRSFYARRILRIFPLYYGALFFVFALAPLVLSAEAASEWTAGQAWYWTYLSNVQVAIFGWQPPLHLGHFWSLAVEEQFYLLWPFLVAVLNRRRLMQVAVLCFIAALPLRMLVLQQLSALAGYVLMPTRMDALAAGAALALIIRGRSSLGVLGMKPLIVVVCGGAASAMLFVWRRGFNELDPVIYLFGYSLFAITFAALIGLCLIASEHSFLRRSLSSQPLMLLGQYSYGLYVFHQPIALALQRNGWTVDRLPVWGDSHLAGLVLFGGMVLTASIACAAVSWHALEMPFLRLKRYFPYRPQVASLPAGAGSVVSAS